MVDPPTPSFKFLLENSELENNDYCFIVEVVAMLTSAALRLVVETDED